MATKINVNGKLTARPGIYAITRARVVNSPQNLSYGNIVLIDTGLGAGYGGGAGISGTNSSGSNSVYNFDSIQAYQAFVKGGELWNLGEPLFKPAGNGIPGVSQLNLIRACETTPATMVYTLTNGSFTVTTVDEGINANGVVSGSTLTNGYAMKMIAGIRDTTKYIFQFYHGTYKGIDPLNNVPYDNISAANAVPVLITNSPEVATLADLFAWMNTDSTFLAGFKLTAHTITTTGAIVPADLTANTGYKLASGGTETYTPAAMTAAIAACNNLDFTFFLCTDYGADAISDNNDLIFDFLVNTSRFERFGWVAAGFDANDWESSSIAAAEYYNSTRIIVNHAGAKKTSKIGFKICSQLWHAAARLGRTCGIAPQTPLTFKRLAIDGEVHELTDDQLDEALDKGVLVTYYDWDIEYYAVLEGINSLQNNAYLVNDDGSSYSIQVMRISAQLNKELVIDLKRTFFAKDMVGPNRNTVSPADVQARVETLLHDRTASTLSDNLIIKFANVTVVPEVGKPNVYDINYDFEPNFEVNQMVATGTIVEG